VPKFRAIWNEKVSRLKRSGSSEKQHVGFLTMSGLYVVQHEDEILGLIRDSVNGPGNEYQRDPLIRIAETPDRSIEVTFTDARLARDIGRDLYQKYGGELEVQVVDDGRSVRVTWWR
jgi:hypothetical protein